MKAFFLVTTLALAFLLSNCSTSSTGLYFPPDPSMEGPTVEQRKVDISQEETGNHYIGRRYYTKNTRFWGYLRKPRQPWSTAKLVMMNEWTKRAPDRLQEGKKDGYGRDSNYEYKIYGSYTGAKVYEPNSDQFLPEFKLTGYELINKDPGWIFSPADKYDSLRVTLTP